MLISLLSLAFLSSTYAMANAEGNTSGNSIIASTENPVIVKNEVLLKKDSVNYTELRHIILKGTNEQIGKALGEIAREDYNVSLNSYADPLYVKARLIYMQNSDPALYAKARLIYMKNNDPAFYERMKGVAEAYNASINSTNLDLSALIYDLGSPGCSIVYFPPSVTSNGHAMTCRNNDYYTSSYEEIIGKTNNSSQPGMFSRTFVLELYPDEGYSSLVVGSNDLMSAMLQGFNSQGLAIEEQIDIFGANATDLSAGGIPLLAAQRVILDTCKNIDEAKIALLNNKVCFEQEGYHFMIYDKYGNSTIAEFFSKNGSVHFIDAFNSIRVMTNHPVSLSRNEYSINNHSPDSYYDSFRRYMTLTNMTSNHTGKFTPKDMVDTLSSVNAEIPYMSMNLRTETNLLQDLTNSTISVRVYLRDGPTDPVIGGPTNIFSKFFNFTLEKDPA